MEKTNVMRILERAEIPYTPHAYDPSVTDGAQVAQMLGQDPGRVFKTLVTVADTRAHYVFVVPVCAKLDLKKAARAAGVKSVEMIAQKELLPLTGYVHGGCSPIGMKKAFAAYFDRTAADLETMICSAGKRGAQIELAPDDLVALTRGAYADLTRADPPNAD